MRKLLILSVLASLVAPGLATANVKKIYLSSINKNYEYNFGDIRIQWPQYHEIEVLNDTDSIVKTSYYNIHDRFDPKTGYTFTGYSNCPYKLSPGQSCKLNLKYESQNFGCFEAPSVFYTSQGTYKILIKGQSLVRWSFENNAPYIDWAACHPPTPH